MNNIKNIKFFIILCSVLAYLKSNGSEIIIVNDNTEEFPITRNYVDVFEDTSSILTIDDITLNTAYKSKFKTSTAKDYINSNLNSAYWLSFQIINSTENQNLFLIENFDYDIDEVSFFYQGKDGKFKEIKAGYKYPFRDRKIDHKNIIIPINLVSERPIHFYMRFKSRKINMLEPILRRVDRLIDYSLDEYILFGIFVGIMLLIIFYNILYFILLKKAFYLYYVIYAVGILLYLMGKNGTGFQYLWYNYPDFNYYITTLSLGAGTLSMLQFFLTFFQIKDRFRKIFYLFIVVMVSRGGYLLLELYHPSYNSIPFIDLIFFQIIFIFGTKLYTKGVKSVKWFIIAYTILNIFCIITFLEHHSIIPSNIFTVYSTYIGVLFQFVYMSIGMGESFREIYRDRNKTQAQLILQYEENKILEKKVTLELENKVSERTKELEDAKQQMQNIANDNIRMNIALDKANVQLQKHLTSFAQSVVMNSHVDFESFKKAYTDDLSCMRYLAALKDENKFTCKICGNNKSIKGKAVFDVRCSKCSYNESITANTIFHKIKFPLQKAFYLVYLVSQARKDITATDLSKILSLQKSTCQNFKNKILEKMEDLKKSGHKNNINWDLVIIDKKYELK